MQSWPSIRAVSAEQLCGVHGAPATFLISCQIPGDQDKFSMVACGPPFNQVYLSAKEDGLTTPIKQQWFSIEETWVRLWISAKGGSAVLCHHLGFVGSMAWGDVKTIACPGSWRLIPFGPVKRQHACMISTRPPAWASFCVASSLSSAAAKAASGPPCHRPERPLLCSLQVGRSAI